MARAEASYFLVGDVRTLFTCLCELAQVTSDVRARIGRRLRNARDRYDWDIISESTMTIFERVTGKCRVVARPRYKDRRRPLRHVADVAASKRHWGSTKHRTSAGRPVPGIGFTLAKYVGISRIIVSQRLIYTVAGGFAEDRNYLDFVSADQCVEVGAGLMQNKPLRDTLMHWRPWGKAPHGGREVPLVRARSAP
jgi:hypothetical protein